MSEPSPEREAVGDRFRRIYNYLNSIATEVSEIRRTYIMIMSGPDLNTVIDIEDDERDLDRDLHRLEKLIKMHQGLF